MQIPIDMTTFTYCIFALGHILARQFPIVGFRPPVRLIDIIGRAADTRLHFYLHTFADQFDPARISLHIYPMDLCVCVFFSFFFFCRLPPPISRGRRFPLGVSARGTNTIVGWQHRDCLVLHRVKTRIVSKYRGDEVVSNCWITIRAERDERVSKLWFWYGESYAVRVIDIFVFSRKLRVKTRVSKTCFFFSVKSLTVHRINYATLTIATVFCL